MTVSHTSFGWYKWQPQGWQEFSPSLTVAGIWNILWRLRKLSKSTAARAAAKQPSGKTMSRHRDLEIPVGTDRFHHIQASSCLSGNSTAPQACCHCRAVRLKGMAHWSNLPGCMTITDTDAPVSIWALLSQQWVCLAGTPLGTGQ